MAVCRHLTANTVLPAAVLSCLLTITQSLATPIYPDDVPQPGLSSLSLEDKRRFTKRLMQTAPLSSDKPSAISELADPLALGHKTGFSMLPERVYFIDLLASPIPSSPSLADIKLPAGALRGIDILEDLNALFLTYDGRAFDNSILQAEDSEITLHRGAPRTHEGTPLNLSNFGKISHRRAH